MTLNLFCVVGAPGKSGTPGPVGEVGVIGMQGPQGPRGPIGEAGVDGEPGQQGPQGAPVSYADNSYIEAALIINYGYQPSLKHIGNAIS